jgi:hypothetical protein
MAINQKVAAFFSGLALAGSLGLAKVVKAEEINPNGWPVPNRANATLVGNDRIRTDLIEGRNIPVIQRVYRTPEGTYFNTLSVKDKDGKEKIYGYLVDIDGKPPMEYGLIDLEGNDLFTHKYGTNEHMTTPAYVLSDKISKK